MVFLSLDAVGAAGRPSSQVRSLGGDPAGGAQRDGNHVLVAAAGQAGKLGQRDPVLHGREQQGDASESSGVPDGAEGFLPLSPFRIWWNSSIFTTTTT